MGNCRKTKTDSGKNTMWNVHKTPKGQFFLRNEETKTIYMEIVEYSDGNEDTKIFFLNESEANKMRDSLNG